MNASAFTITSVPSTVYARMCAPVSMVQLSPITTGPSIRASGLIVTSLPIHSLSPIRKPLMSTRTRPSRTSVWARMYASSAPTSSQ